MTKKSDHAHEGDDPVPFPTLPKLESDEKVLHEKATKPAPTPQEVPTTRVLLTTRDRNVVTEEWVPTAEYGFRINVNGQHFEQVDVAADSGTVIFAPTD